MATKIGTFPQVAAADLSENSSVQQHQLGLKVVADDGREFRYAKAGAADLVVGNLLQGPAEVANHQNCAPANTAIGATSVTVTLGNTAVAANYYANGWMAVEVTPGIGYLYKIKSHPAASGSATCVFTLEDPIVVALTAANSKVDLIANPYSGVIQNPASASGSPVGVAQRIITAGYYGWIQTGGVANVLNDGGVTAGQAVVASNATAGAVEASTGAQATVGLAVHAASTTECGPVLLRLP